jgi:hypothetical protein
MVNERHLAHTEDHITFQDVDITLQMYFCRFNGRADLREAKPHCRTARSADVYQMPLHLHHGRSVASSILDSGHETGMSSRLCSRTIEGVQKRCSI